MTDFIGLSATACSLEIQGVAMRSFPIFVLALLSATMAACAHDPDRATVSSTEGSTLVRTGEVTAVNESQLTVRLEDGELRVFQSPGLFHVGDHVKVSSHKGEVRITH